MNPREKHTSRSIFHTHHMRTQKYSATPVLLRGLALFTIAALAATCVRAVEATHSESDHEEGERVVHLSPDIMTEFGIEVSMVSHGVLRDEVVLPGEINYNRERIAYVTPRYAGTLQKIRVRLGDKVGKGDILATLESSETLRPFDVVAPFDGTVVAYELTAGQTVEAGRSLFTVADLATVWADLRIYQKDIASVTRGQRVRIERGHGVEPFTGEIAYVAPTVDEHTRTGLARVVVDNASGNWKPGLFVKATVSLGERPVNVLVPRSAVMTMNDVTVVFVQTPEGLEPHPVRLGSSDSLSFEVLQGVSPGEKIVTANALTVKAELEKGSFGEGHNH